MFVKLNFTADKTFVHIRQILNAIINDTAIDSVAALGAAAASWNSAITAGIDYSTTEIIRTVEPTTVRSHLGQIAMNASGGLVWTMEFQVYDAPTRKYYISFDSTYTGGPTVSNNRSRIHVGDTVASGDMDAAQASMSVDLNAEAFTTTSGTPVILSSEAPAQLLTGVDAYNDIVAPQNSTNIRTFWMYLNNDCLMVAHTGAESSNLGFNNTYTNAANYSGPYIFSQYNRYDYHNTDANGVIPLMFYNITRTSNNTTASPGLGFGVGRLTLSDWARIENVNFSTDTTNSAFHVFNMIDAHVEVGSSWPLMSFPSVNWGSGGRVTEHFALTTNATGTAATSVTAGRLIHTASQTRYPSADLSTVGYGMLPLRWSNSYRGNQGGNATDRGGFYIFNGDYFPGDTFTYEGKTYIIWPTFRGYTDRVGIAVPKE